MRGVIGAALIAAVGESAPPGTDLDAPTTCREHLMIAFEHENNRTAYLEVEKLVKIDAPLNVVVTYGSSRTREKDLASCAEVFRKGGRLTGQHLIIHGTLAGDAIDWCYRVWNGNALVAL